MTFTLGDASEIPRNGRRFYTVNGENVAVLDVEGTLYAIRNSCPHMGGPLGQGKVARKLPKVATFVSPYRDFTPSTGIVRKPAVTVDENAPLTISCPLHGWEFDLADGTPFFPAKRGVRTYAVRVEDGLIKLELPTDDAPMPACAGGCGCTSGGCSETSRNVASTSEPTPGTVPTG